MEVPRDKRYRTARYLSKLPFRGRERLLFSGRSFVSSGEKRCLLNELEDNQKGLFIGTRNLCGVADRGKDLRLHEWSRNLLLQTYTYSKC